MIRPNNMADAISAAARYAEAATSRDRRAQASIEAEHRRQREEIMARVAARHAARAAANAVKRA